MDSAKGLLCEFPWDGKSKGNDASVMTNLENKKRPAVSCAIEEPKTQDVTGMFFFPNKNFIVSNFFGSYFLGGLVYNTI